MRRPLLGEIWRADFGLAAKIRPVLIFSDYPDDDELALVLVIPHTTAVRNNKWELAIPKPFLKPGVFHLQQIQPIPLARLDIRMGALTEEELTRVRVAVVQLLHLRPGI